MRGVETVVRDGVAEYAELAALEGGQCGLLEEIVLLNQKFEASELAVKCPSISKLTFGKIGHFGRVPLSYLDFPRFPLEKKLHYRQLKTTGVGQSIDC